MNFPTLRAAVAVCLSATLHAAGLKTGDAAPEIRESSWVRGTEVKTFEGDKVYIVEFWATWCGPCVASIPHLDELQKKYEAKGLVVIGQNLGEDAGTIAPFIKSMKGKMGYRVAADDKAEGGWMAKHWLAAAGQNGIPCAFVVNKAGRIAYIGHPGNLEESLLEKLLAEPSTKTETEEEPAAPEPLSAKAVALADRARAEIAAGKLGEAEATLGSLQESLSPNYGYIAGLLELELLLAKKNPDDAIELSKLLCEDYAKKPEVIVSIAALLVSRQDAAVKAGLADAKLQFAAAKIAAPLAEAPGPAQGAALSTLARIASLKGAKELEAELLTKARALAPKSGEAAAKAGPEAKKTSPAP